MSVLFAVRFFVFFLLTRNLLRGSCQKTFFFYMSSLGCKLETYIFVSKQVVVVGIGVFLKILTSTICLIKFKDLPSCHIPIQH